MKTGHRVELPVELEDQIRKSLGAYYHTPGRWSFESVHCRRGVSVLRVDDNMWGRQVAIKINPRPEKNEEQFRALEAIQRRTGACARPLYIADDRHFLMMDWIEAPLLREPTGKR